jgi:3-oxoacyl-[acyl-carrier-protein] synthase-1
MTVYLNALGVVCALGRDKEEVARNLFAGDCSGMRSETGWVAERSLPVGAVTGELVPIPVELTCQRSRNNQLLMEAALQIRPDIDQAIRRYGRDRIGIVLGTSTSGIDEASQGLALYVREQQFPADYDYQQQELGAPANFLADWLQLSGPAYVISTACTSSARALMSAQRLLDLGICDVVLCGGVDTLCKLTLNGFSALDAVDNVAIRVRLTAMASISAKRPCCS